MGMEPDNGGIQIVRPLDDLCAYVITQLQVIGRLVIELLWEYSSPIHNLIRPLLARHETGIAKCRLLVALALGHQVLPETPMVPRCFRWNQRWGRRSLPATK